MRWYLMNFRTKKIVKLAHRVIIGYYNVLKQKYTFTYEKVLLLFSIFAQVGYNSSHLGW